MNIPHFTKTQDLIQIDAIHEPAIKLNCSLTEGARLAANFNPWFIDVQMV